MGTKALLAVIADYRDHMTDSLATEISSAQRVTDERNLRLCEDARAELEAIRKAAKVLAKAEIFCGPSVPGEDFTAMHTTIMAIAREGP